MGTNTGHVMTLANSIIGVSVLAMPFCFKQCGIVLATLMLILSSIMTRLACHYLIKSATLARRRNFEFLAFHTFGPTGKMTVELSIIGFMLGTCIAFFVVVGDLGPAILGPVLNIDNPSSIRASVLTAIALFVVLPLGLLRNVDSLAAISAATIAFYICLVLKVMGEATTHLIAWDWTDKVVLWRPAGLLQCLPIFSMALSCQTQLFEIFDSIPNASLEKMNAVVRSAINLCTVVYMIMGFFGYVAFCTQPFSGNLMLSFSQTPTSEVIKMGFVLSVAVSFPLVIFPCRASLHSLLFRRGIPPHYELMASSNHIPEPRFKYLTLSIVAVSLVTGILIPNIELVLGLVGSTIGVLICIIIPAVLFLRLTNKNNNERLLAQVLFIMGLLIMILGSYANLYATEEAIVNSEPELIPVKPTIALPTINLLPQEAKAQIKDDTLKDIKNVEQLAAALPNLMKETPPPAKVAAVEADVRKEPPVPEAPEVKVISESPPAQKPKEEIKETKVEEMKKQDDVKEKPVLDINKKEEVINTDALKKEDDEIKEVQKQDILKKKEELIEKLEANEQKQQILLEEQKKLLQDIKIEKEKLIEENEQLKKEDVLEDKNKAGQQMNVQNEVLEEQKKIINDIPQKKSNIENLAKPESFDVRPKVEETVAKKVEAKRDYSLDNVIKDDVVKKNMADGVPLPIAIQNVMPRIGGVKAVKIVDNVANPNEGNAESKVLRREILEQNEGVKEQREKRDLQEVVNLDLKEEVEEKVLLTSLNVSIESDKLISEDLDKESKEIIVDDVAKIKQNAKLQEPISFEDVKTSLLVKEKLEENEEQCEDKEKIPQEKFSDDLKVLNKKTSVVENTETKLKPEPKPSLENKNEESLIKTPAYLSEPRIVLPVDNVGNPDNYLENAIKPMKRDLKSLTSTNKESVKDKKT